MGGDYDAPPIYDTRQQEGNMSDRSNTWGCVIYPDDSCPDNYIQIIQNWHIAALLSPIHDKDKNGDETEKKKHIHLLIYFGVGQNKSLNQVRQFTDQLNGTIPIIIHNTNAMIRYFIHKDNPEKIQYDINDIVSLSGFEYRLAFENYTTDEQLYCAVEDVIKKEAIYNLVTLEIYLKQHNMNYELMFCRKHIGYFNYYLNSMYQRIKYNEN